MKKIPKMIPVKSSNIAKVGYDKPNEDLYVEFTNGAVYVYAKVPEARAIEFIESPSKGAYMHQFIRDVYVASEVTAAKPTSKPAAKAKATKSKPKR